MTTNTQTVSHNKIILFLVFLCAAVMSSLFIFHMSHKAPAPVIPAEQGLVFAAPRDIKPFDLVSMDEKKFSQQNFLGHWTLLVFGFTHCSNVCPANLEMISRVYNKLHTAIPNLQVALISLDPERDSVDELKKYTKSFHPEFIGVSGKLQELRKLQSQLGIYAARDDASPANNYQLQHTASILLVNPKGKWAGIFAYGLKPEQFASAVEKNVKTG